MSCQSQYRRTRSVVAVFDFPNLACCCVTVHVRHLDVHQNKIVAARMEQFHSRCTVFRYIDQDLRVFQIGKDQEPVVFGVVDEKNSEPGGSALQFPNS